MIISRGYRFRLYPTPEQEVILRQHVGVCRLVYNLALEQRRDFWRQYLQKTGKHISFASQCRELTELRAAFDWIAAAPSAAQSYALRDLDTAYRAFFSGRAGYPTPRRKGGSGGFRLNGCCVATRALNSKWAALRVPNLGYVKYRPSAVMLGSLKNVTISCRAGAWYAAFVCQREVEVAGSTLPMVGIDRGISQTLTLSTGEHLQSPPVARLSSRVKLAQRVLARRRRGSRRYAAQKLRLGRLSARVARIREDWSHRASISVARRFGSVAIEDLNIRGMTGSAKGTLADPGRNIRQKAGLNRAILEQSWGRWATLLDYKLAERGGVLISVPAAYTSQTCASCGVIDARSRKSQAVFNCVACDHTDNADVNAAKEILRRSTAWLDVEGSVSRPLKRQLGGRQHV